MEARSRGLAGGADRLAELLADPLGMLSAVVCDGLLAVAAMTDGGWTRGNGRHLISLADRPVLMQNVIRLRRERGWEREELVQRSGLSIWTVRAVENGRHSVQRRTVELLAEAFGLTDPDELLAMPDGPRAGFRQALDDLRLTVLATGRWRMAAIELRQAARRLRVR